MPRYTRMVGWLVRTATLVLTVLVGGGPAIAVVCETIVHRMQRSITQEPRRRLTPNTTIRWFTRMPAPTAPTPTMWIINKPTRRPAIRVGASAETAVGSSHHLGIRWRLRESTRICSRHLTLRCSHSSEPHGK